MADEKKPRALATQAAAKIPKMARDNLVATVKAREEGKKVAYSFIVCAVDDIMRAMDIVPAWGESFSGICSAKRDAERFLQKAEADNFSRSLCTYATCSLGFDMWREELGGEMPPKPALGRDRQARHDPRQRPAALRPEVQVAPGHAALPPGRARLCRGHVLPPVGPHYRPQGTGSILRQVQHRATSRLRQLLRESDGQENGLGQARRSSRPDGPHLEPLRRDLRAEENGALPHGYGGRDEYDGPHLVHGRHAGMLRLLQGPERRAKTEDRSEAGRGRE